MASAVPAVAAAAGLNINVNGESRLFSGPFTGETFRHVLRNHTGYALSLFSKPTHEILPMLPFVLWCAHKLSR